MDSPDRSENSQAVLEHLLSQQESMTKLLKTLVTMESPSTDPTSQQEIRVHLKKELEDLDYQVILIPGHSSGGHLYASPNQRTKNKPVQLMMGHCDTVWPVGTIKNMPLIHEDNILKGPGVYDMKAGLVEMVFALRTLNTLNLQPEVTPAVFINSDEEIGSRESTRYIKALAKCVNRVMVMEPSLGTKGKLKTARKGVGRFTIRVKGKAAHAGLDPNAGASAILELSHVIQKLFELNDPERGTSVNVGVIDGGIRPNMVAPESSAVVDVRVETQKDAERVENAIHGLAPAIPDVSLEIEGRIGRPPMEPTEQNQQLWRIAKGIGTNIKLELEQGTAGGGSDGNTTSLYTATLDGMGAVGDGAHAAHEFVFLDLLPVRCALLTLLLLAPPLKTHCR